MLQQCDPLPEKFERCSVLIGRTRMKEWVLPRPRHSGALSTWLHIRASLIANIERRNWFMLIRFRPSAVLPCAGRKKWIWSVSENSTINWKSSMILHKKTKVKAITLAMIDEKNNACMITVTRDAFVMWFQVWSTRFTERYFEGHDAWRFTVSQQFSHWRAHIHLHLPQPGIHESVTKA